jgi:transcriptional regulator with XRE-family HTH domain
VSIGETLAVARHQAGLTVTQVSERTRIRETVIEKIEGDDYSACGGDFYARGYIRMIAKVAGADPEPLIREYDASHRAPGALSAVSMAELATSAQEAGRRGLNRTPLLAVGLAVALLVALGFLVDNLLAGPGRAASAPSAAGNHVLAHRHGGHLATAAPTPRPTIAARPTTTAPTTIPARPLSPVSAAAFDPYSAGQGDSPQLAPLAIDGNPATAWHTDWYATARFGNLYPGTGLLLDMGRPVTITSARITLASVPGADLQLRVGAAPALADLPPVAGAADAGGVVPLRLAAPAHGRYVLIWFTRLPPDSAGTFQASVYDVRLAGYG